MLPAVLLAMIGLASPGSGADVQIEVLEGRVSLALTDGVSEVRPGQAPRLVPGPGYVEVPALSRVSLRWRQTGSLLIEGPAAFEWSPEQDRLIWSFREVGQTHLEIRSSRVRLYLPGGWTAAFENGASFLTERSGSSVEFHHDAGLPVLLSGPTRSGSARPPWTILAGARLLLRSSGGRPAALRGTQGRMLEPYARPEAFARERQVSGARWSGFSWPWRARADQPVAAVAPAVESALMAESSPGLNRLDPATPVEHEPDSRGASAPPSGDGVLPEPGPSPRATPPVNGGPGEPLEQAQPALPADADEAGGAGQLGSEAPPAAPGQPAPGEPGTWPRFNSNIRRDGQLMLSPYGVRWRDYASRSSTAPEQP